MPPKLAELLGLENPFKDSAWYDTCGPYQETAYNRALEDVGEKMAPLHVGGLKISYWNNDGAFGTLEDDRPGFLAWIPESGEIEESWMNSASNTFADATTTTGIQSWSKVQVVDCLPHPQQWAIEGW